MTQEALEVIRLWLVALTTPVVAGFGAWIAYQQHRVQKYRLVYDVSGSRLSVFNAARQLVIAACSDAATTNESLFTFQLATVEAPYLFKEDAVVYIEELERRFLKMLELKDAIVDHSENESELGDLRRAQGELRDIRQGMRCELGHLREKFRPYLDLSAI